MIKLISSSLTFFYKYIFSFLWITGVGSGALALMFSTNSFHDKAGHPPPAAVGWQFMVMWMVGSLFIWWFCMRLKRVQMDDEVLYISNYLEEIRVPLKDVTGVSENRIVNSHPVTLKFGNKTRFGFSVVFVPKVRLFSVFSPHPVVSEIQAAVERAKRK